MNKSSNPLPYVEPPKLKPEYVCWLDIMGMRSLLRRSVKTASIIISRFQKLLDNTKSSNSNFNEIKIYTVMDGAYITCPEKNELQDFLKVVFSVVAQAFTEEEKFFNKFIIKGCIAYGLIGKGSEIKNDKFQGKEGLVFGLPIIQAYEDEKKHLPLEFLYTNQPELYRK
jgi:hypothetical protein